MDGVTGLRLSSVSLPYNFEQGADAAGMALDTQLGPGGVIEAHLDSCEGAVVASSPLDDPTQSVRQLTLLPLAPVTGRHVLCLQMRRSRPGPFWALERAALMMAEPMKNPPTP
jgi:hexosaminidase